MGEYGIIMIDIKICKGSVSTTRPGHVIPTILQFSGAIRIQEVDFPDGKKQQPLPGGTGRTSPNQKLV